MAWLGRLTAALLVVLMSTTLALLAMLALAFRLGYDPGTPARLNAAEEALATANARARVLETEVAALNARNVAAEVALDALDAQIARLEAQSGDFARSADAMATAMEEAREIQVQVAVFATAEAGRVELLADLERRSERVERFLQRLSDIAADTSLDLSTPTLDATAPAPTATAPAPTATEIPTPTRQPGPTLTPRPTRNTTS
jgi:hypothetical protein